MRHLLLLSCLPLGLMAGSAAHAANEVALIPHVATTAVLKTIESTAYETIIRDGGLVVGDGAAVYTSSAVACSLNAGNGDDDTQIKSADGGCWLQDAIRTTNLTVTGVTGSVVANPSSTIGIMLNSTLIDKRFETDPIRHDALLGFHYWSPTADTAETGNGVLGLGWAAGSHNFAGWNNGLGGTFAHNGTGTVARGIGVYGSCENDTAPATGIISNCIGLYADKVYPVIGGTVDNSYGVFVVSGSAATKNYGVFFDGTFGADGSIASANGVDITINPGGAAHNGKLGINLTTPGATVDVNGPVRSNSYFIAKNGVTDEGYFGSLNSILGSGAVDPAIYTNSGNIRLANGGVIVDKKTASASAPGVGTMKLEVVAGTGVGTCKLIAYAGTSAAAVTVIDNVGAGC